MLDARFSMLDNLHIIYGGIENIQYLSEADSKSSKILRKSPLVFI